MNANIPPTARDDDTIRPTVWGYAVHGTARCAQGDVPGVPRRVPTRTDVLVRGLTPRELDRVRQHVARRVARGPLSAVLAGPRLTRVERRALREAVEIRRARVAPPTSGAVTVLLAMSAVESVADRLDDTGAAYARELLWCALTAVRSGDDRALHHATGALLRLVVATTTATLVPDDHVG